MRVATVAALAGVAAASWAPHGGNSGSWGSGSNATVPDVYVTEVVTALTTFCPKATEITHNGQTYTVTSATTLTITDCPCTVTKPVYSTSYPVGTAPAPAPGKPAPSGVAPVGTAPVGTGSMPGPSSPSSPIIPSTGAGSQLKAGVAAVLAVFGLVAAL